MGIERRPQFMAHILPGIGSWPWWRQSRAFSDSSQLRVLTLTQVVFSRFSIWRQHFQLKNGQLEKPNFVSCASPLETE